MKNESSLNVENIRLNLGNNYLSGHTTTAIDRRYVTLPSFATA